MSRLRLLLGIFLVVAVLAWSLPVLFAQSVRITHRPLVAAIVQGTQQPALTEDSRNNFDAALGDYASALRFLPCHVGLQRDRMLLLGAKADAALAGEDLTAYDADLDTLEYAITEHLACAPRDGKSWLDLATIRMHRSGANARVFEAVLHSAKVAPGESWLAQKRLQLAVAIAPVLDAPMRALAERDLDVLARAHPNRLQAVLQDAGQPDINALQTWLLTAQIAPETPSSTP
jgi:hypothetical protein